MSGSGFETLKPVSLSDGLESDHGYLSVVEK